MSRVISFVKSLLANHKTEMGMVSGAAVLFSGRQGWMDDGTRDLLLSAVALWTGVAVSRTKAKQAAAIAEASEQVASAQTVLKAVTNLAKNDKA